MDSSDESFVDVKDETSGGLSSDISLINDMKYSTEKQLRDYIERSQPFATKEKLKNKFVDIKSQALEGFGRLSHSNDPKVIIDWKESLKSDLDKIYQIISSENDKQRDRHSDRCFHNCIKEFSASCEQITDSNFCSDVQELDDKLNQQKKKSLQAFKKLFGDEEEEVFGRDLFKLNKEMDSLIREAKSDIKEKLVDAKEKNNKAVNEAINNYKKQMREVVESKNFVSKEVFKQKEKEIAKNVMKEFKDNCSGGDSQFQKNFEMVVLVTIAELKKEFKESVQNKCDTISKVTEEALKESLECYNKLMDCQFKDIQTEPQLNGKHHELFDKCLEVFKNDCPIKEAEALRPYSDRLKDGMNKSFNEWRNKFTESMEKHKTSLANKVTLIKDSYIKIMDQTLSNGRALSDESLTQLHSEILGQSLDILDNYLNDIHISGDCSDFKRQVEQTLSEELVKYSERNEKIRLTKTLNVQKFMEELVEEYEKRIDDQVDSFNSVDDMQVFDRDVKTKMIDNFSKDIEWLPKNEIEEIVSKLKAKFAKVFNEAKQVLEFRLVNSLHENESLKTEVIQFYEKEMANLFDNKSFIRRETLNNYHKIVVEQAFDRFSNRSHFNTATNEEIRKNINHWVGDTHTRLYTEVIMNAPTIPAIGIDLGTTNSCVAVYNPRIKGVVVIPNKGANLTPSVVSVRGSGDSGIVVGDVAKREKGAYPKNTVYSAKRLIGRQFSDPKFKETKKRLDYNIIKDEFDNIKIKMTVHNAPVEYYPEQISAQVLKKMKSVAEDFLQIKPITKAVITVPAYFNDSQKEATKDAGRLAGLEVLKIINEPTAAAMAFQLNKNIGSSRKVLIYDFGGGTLDVAILNIENNGIEVLTVGGDNLLGGDDFDDVLFYYCLNKYCSDLRISVPSMDKLKANQTGHDAIIRLKDACEECKRTLSEAPEATVRVRDIFRSKDLRVHVTRQKFEELCEHLIQKSLVCVAQTIEDAGLTHAKIDEIVLVGGTTKIPKVTEMLSKQFGGRLLNHTVNPDEAVAIGAAIQAAIINGEKAESLGHLNVRDVAPISLGVKVKDQGSGDMSTIVPRNSKVPNETDYKRYYTNVQDFQTSVDVVVYEGEDQYVANNRQLGTFELTGLKPAKAGEHNIEVLFAINDEGILKVKANVVNSGIEKQIEIKEHKGRLSDEELQRMINQTQ